jgi:5-oxoprolinase (ATP-hydrolysing)
LLESDIVIDDIKVGEWRIRANSQVKGTGKSASSAGPSVFEEMKTLNTANVDTARGSKKVSSFQEVYVCPPGQTYGERVQTPVFVLDQLDRGDVIAGPALIIDATQTIFVNA